MADPRQAIRDELLVLDCLKGSSDALRALVARWQEPWWRHAYRLTGRDDAAWDVLQETWVGMASGIHKLRDPGNFRRWAYTIVTRRAADWVNTQRNNGMLAELDESMPADTLARELEPW